MALLFDPPPTATDFACEFRLLLEVPLLVILEVAALVEREIVLTLRDEEEEARDETDEEVSTDSQDESDEAVSSKIGELDSFVSHPSEP